MPLSHETQERLFKETDARFAAQSGITRKLDPKNPIDAKLIPEWTRIYNGVARDYNAGILAFTYDHPFVQQSLEAASMLTDKAAGHFDEALRAAASGVASGAASALASAETARKAAQVATAQAASMQPAVIDPGAVTAAAASAFGIPPLTPHDAVTQMQVAQAPGVALGVHTQGDPNPLHFTMPGGQQGYEGSAGGAAPKRSKAEGLAIAAGAVGAGVLLMGLITAATSPKRQSSGGSRGSRTVVIRRDRVYGGR